MSLKVDTRKTAYHIMVDDFNGKLSEHHKITYITGGDVCKLGRTGRIGQTPEEAVINRYASSLSARGSDMIITDIIVHNATDFNHDNELRRRFRYFNKHGRISWTANVEEFQEDGLNHESLIAYDRSKHLGELIDITKEYLGLLPNYDARTNIQWRYMQEDDVRQIVEKVTLYNSCNK
jgi:hypothetical protein